MSPQTASHDSKAALADILSRIAAARKAALSPAPRTELIAVSKTHGEDEILPVLDAGHRLFGENRVQEAKAKWAALRERYTGIELHLIGPLQTNKAREAIELFRRDPFGGPAEAGRDSQTGMHARRAHAAAFRAGEHGRGAAEGGHRAEGNGRVSFPLPPDAAIAHRRIDVHPARE